jgi:DNA-binding NarL/FixJ family response regulator
MKTPTKIRVLLVDDHLMVRQTLRKLLKPFPNIEIIGEAADGDEAVAEVGTLRPTVVVMDINMQKMDGVTAARLINTQYPDIAIVGLSADPKDYNVYAMERAGAFEVFTKERAYENLYDAIQRAVAANRSVLTLENAHSRKDGATS